MSTASPNATASSTLPVRARGPAASAARFDCSPSRSENMISCPAFAHSPPSVEPMRPEPITPILAFACAGKVIDSSPMYGSSESVAGDLIAELGLRERLFIATKVYTSGRDAGIQQMETSFKRLRVERMDLMQVHNLVDVATHTETLKQWKEKGRVRHIGITHYTAFAYAEVERWLQTGAYDFVQINYSLAERDARKDGGVLRLALAAVDEARGLDVGLEFLRQGSGLQRHDLRRQLELLLHRRRNGAADRSRVCAAPHLDREAQHVVAAFVERF